MSRADLERLRAANALPHTLQYEELVPYHVPFDELTGASSVESELAHWLPRRGRVALVGASGSGKSSALAWAIDRHAPENLAALRIPIALADDETVQTTEGFGRHVIRRVIAAAHMEETDAAELRARSADTVRRRGEERRRGGRLGLRAGPITGELARELTQYGGEFEEQIRAGEVVEGLQRLVELFRARETEPLLVLEDSDVAPRLERIDVPPLPNPEADLTRIVAQRLQVANRDFGVEDVFEPAALSVLAGIYEDLPDIRRAISTAATAVRLALEEPELDRVPAAAVRAAAAERDGGRHSTA